MKEPSDPPGSESAPSSSNSQVASFLQSSTTVQTVTSSIPYSCPLVPAQQKTFEKSSLNMLQQNMKPLVTEKSGEDKAVLLSESLKQFISLQQITPTRAVQSLGMFGSLPAPGPRPLIPVNSSNFQFQPAVVQNTRSSLLCDGNAGSDSSCAVKNPAPSFQAAKSALPGPPPMPAELRRPELPGPPPFPTELRRVDLPGQPPLPTELRRTDLPRPPPLPAELRRPPLLGPPPFPIELRQTAIPGPSPSPAELRQPALPGPPPLPIEILQSFIQSKKNLPNGSINGKMLQAEIHTMNHMVKTGQPSFPRIQKNSSGSIDDDDLPEFDFNSACEEQPDAPMSRLTHFPAATPPPLHKAFSFEAAKAESFEAFQNRRTNTSPLSAKILTSSEGFVLQKFGDNISEKKLGNHDSRHDPGLKHKNMWDDDDEDMPEWCPPDLDPPELPLPRVSENSRPPAGRTPPPPSLSIHLPHSRDLQQAFLHGLLGQRPSSDAHAGGSRPTDSVRPHAGKVKFNRRPPRYAAEHRRRRR